MVEQKAGLYEEVYNYILELIFKQELSYGQKIPEEVISQNLGVSRTPIREALRKLESDGLVEILPKRFAKIVTLEEEDMRQMGIAKLQLDFLTAQMAVFNGSNYNFKKLEEINREMYNALKAQDVYNVLRKDMEFHRTYTEISGNNVLIGFQTQLQLKIALFQSIRLKDNPQLMSSSYETHQAIIAALYSRDIMCVLRNIVPHISAFYKLDADVYSLMVTDFSHGRTALPNNSVPLYHADEITSSAG